MTTKNGERNGEIFVFERRFFPASFSASFLLLADFRPNFHHQVSDRFRAMISSLGFRAAVNDFSLLFLASLAPCSRARFSLLSLLRRDL